MTCYERGDKVWVVSPIDGSKTKAVFVSHDEQGFPSKDVILAVKIGSYKHTYRWPLWLVRPT